MWFNNTTLRSYSDWGLSLTLKELVMWAFFPLFVFTGRNKEGGTNHWVRAFAPPCQRQSHWGSYARAHTHTEMHTRVSWRALISLGGRGEGWRVRQRETEREEGGGQRDKSPPPSWTQRGVSLKGCSVSPWEDGVGWWGSICGGQWSCWSAQGAPRYPVIHDNQRGRGGGGGEGGVTTWKSSAAVRERSVGAESEEQSTQWFSFFPSLSALYCPQTCPSFLYWK